MATRYCESINAREFASVFLARVNENEIDYKSFQAPQSALLELEDFLNVGFGFIPNPDCLEDDCGCCKCGYDSLDDDVHSGECLGESEPAECRFGLLWYYIPEGVNFKIAYDASLMALRKMGAKSKGGYKIFGPESLCFCGRCDRIDLETFEEFLMDEFEAINDAEPSKKENVGLGLENAEILSAINQGEECVLPDGSNLTFDISTEKIVHTSTENVIAYFHIPNLGSLLISYGKDSMTDEETQVFKNASKFIGAKRYSNSTVDAIWRTDESDEAVSYKSARATVLDSSTNHILRIGKEAIAEEEVGLILAGKHSLNRKFKELNKHYAIPYSQRPAHHMTKNNRYMNIIPSGYFITLEGGIEANEATIHLPNEGNDSESTLSLVKRVDGFALRFGAKNAEMILNLAMTCGKKNTIGFKGWESNPKIMRNGEFHNASSTNDLTAAKNLLLAKRMHPSENEGVSADCVKFLAKSPGNGVVCLLELRDGSDDAIWHSLVKNLSIDTPSGSRDSPQLGVIRTKEGKTYPFVSFPLKLRLENGFKPEEHA